MTTQPNQPTTTTQKIWPSLAKKIATGTTKTKTIEKKIELTKTIKPKKERTDFCFSHSPKFWNSKTIWTEQGKIYRDFTKSGEQSKTPETLFFNKWKALIDQWKTPNDTFDNLTLTTFLNHFKPNEQYAKLITILRNNREQIHEDMMNNDKGQTK